MTVRITEAQALAFRLQRQLRPRDTALDVIRSHIGVQAQVPALADQAVGMRLRSPRPDATTEALAAREVMRVWAMRGTLHLVAVELAGDVLAVMASLRTWEKRAWQRSFGATADDVQALAEAATDALAGGPLTREALVDALVSRTGRPGLADALQSGWGALALKPLAFFQGVLCHGVPDGTRATFERPDRWSARFTTTPDVAEAGRRLVSAWLETYGPSTPEALNQWLARGALRKRDLRDWFAECAAPLAEVSVAGSPAWCLATDVDTLARQSTDPTVHLLPGFDPYVLGCGTRDTRVVPAAHRPRVSRPGGWISPVILIDGRVRGTWSLEDDAVTPAWFERSSRRPGPCAGASGSGAGALASPRGQFRDPLTRRARARSLCPGVSFPVTMTHPGVGHMTGRRAWRE